MQSVRNSSLIALAKARVWESEGWHVLIADPEGREHDIAQLAEITAFKPEKLTALSAILPADEAVTTMTVADNDDGREDSPALQIEELHGPWLAEPHGPWPAMAQDTLSEHAGELLSS